MVFFLSIDVNRAYLFEFTINVYISVIFSIEEKIQTRYELNNNFVRLMRFSFTYPISL